MFIAIGILVVLLVVITILYMRQSKFGDTAKGERLQRMEASNHFNTKDGVFENISFTPTLTEGHSMAGIVKDQFFKKHPGRTPSQPLPHITTDLKSLSADANWLVWFGHSSYLLQVDELKILVDPVFSGNASPVPGSVKAFDGTNTYGVDDMPEIDYILISHDHYDHLDYETITAILPKVKKVVCGLGVGAHFEKWGYAPENIIETDWWEDVALAPGITLHSTPTRHFSGRKFKRSTTLWQSYVVEAPTFKVYIGGDSGYDTHFAQIGEKYGPFDLAILENGQYNKAWEAIHMLPEQLFLAATDLKTERIFPVHSSKFALAMHTWHEPLSEVKRINEEYKFPLVTPLIGEVVNLSDSTQQFTYWWEGIEKKKD